MANVVLTNTSASLSGKAVPVLDAANAFTGANTFVGANQVEIADLGSGGNPSLRFATDTDCGLALVGSNSWALVAGGTNLITLERSNANTAAPKITVASGAYGNAAGQTGPIFKIGRSTSGSTAPGSLELVDKDGVSWYLWADTTGDLRIANAPVQADGTPSDTSGTVVGTQS